jgi:type IV secretory pathway TraG/TraD family ATPase VirD4
LDEVLRLAHGGNDPADPGEVLIMASGHPPIRGLKSRYYYDREFMRRASMPPPAHSDRVAHDWSHWLDHKAVLGSAKEEQTQAGPQGLVVSQPGTKQGSLL